MGLPHPLGSLLMESSGLEVLPRGQCPKDNSAGGLKTSPCEHPTSASIVISSTCDFVISQWGRGKQAHPWLSPQPSPPSVEGFLLCIVAGALTVGLVRQCQTIHGRDRTCIPPRLPPEWITTLFFIIMGIISLTVTCGLLVASHWRREATKYARWIAFTGSKCAVEEVRLAWAGGLTWQMDSLISTRYPHLNKRTCSW